MTYRWHHFEKKGKFVGETMMILNYKSKDFHLSLLHYAKNYGRLTRVTRLKVAENMADPTCLLKRPRTLKHC